MITGRLQLVSSTVSWCSRLLLPRPIRLYSGRVKGYNYSCRRHEDERNSPVQFHTILTLDALG